MATYVTSSIHCVCPIREPSKYFAINTINHTLNTNNSHLIIIIISGVLLSPWQNAYHWTVHIATILLDSIPSRKIVKCA